MIEGPVAILQPGKRADQIAEPLLLHRAADRHDAERALAARAPLRRLDAGQVEPVIDQLDPPRLGGQRLQIVEIDLRAGHPEGGRAQLLGQLPGLRGPDVLGMGGERPADPADRRGIARHRGRRVQIMGVQPADVVGQLMGKDAGLTEAPVAVGGRVAPQIGLEHRPRRLIARLPLGKGAAGPHPRRIVLQIFRQIEDLGIDPPMHRMHPFLGRLAQRHDELRDAAILEPGDLLGDEGLRQPRIPLDDRGDASCHGGRSLRQRPALAEDDRQVPVPRRKAGRMPAI